MRAKFNSGRAYDIHELTYWNTQLDTDMYNEMTEGTIKMDL